VCQIRTSNVSYYFKLCPRGIPTSACALRRARKDWHQSVHVDAIVVFRGLFFEPPSGKNSIFFAAVCSAVCRHITIHVAYMSSNTYVCRETISPTSLKQFLSS
jgi:hypothetical protein